MTISTLTFISSEGDHGSLIVCRASDQMNEDGELEDSVKLNVKYVPKALLTLGVSLNGSNIKEEDDVYFECHIRSNPRPYKITWRFNEQILAHNISQGIIVSNQSLVLQKVRKSQSGIYICIAHNSEGDGVSNPITLNVRYVPYCKPDQLMVYGVARFQDIDVLCDVISNPTNSVVFHWVFNTSGSDQRNPMKSSVTVKGTSSVLKYKPLQENDFGNLLCWGENSVGLQKEPCTFHIVPAGPPDPVHNCSVFNYTSSGLEIKCDSGFDGGFVQSFTITVLEAKTHQIVMKRIARTSNFKVTHLLPGKGYVLSVVSQNRKGTSEPVTLHTFTIDESKSEHIVDGTKKNSDKVMATPVYISILIGLSLVMVSLALVMRFKHRKRRNSNAVHRQNNKLETDIQLQSDNLLGNEPDLIPHNRDFIEEEEAFDQYKEQQYAESFKGDKRFTRFATTSFHYDHTVPKEESMYSDLTLPRGKEYNKMIRTGNSEILQNKCDRSRLGFSMTLPSRTKIAQQDHSRTTCFPGQFSREDEEISSRTPLVGKVQYVTYSSPSQKEDEDRV